VPTLHLDRAVDGSQDEDLIEAASAFAAVKGCAAALDTWYDGGRQGERPPGRLRSHVPERLHRWGKAWAVPVSRLVYDPDGRAVRDRLRHRP
jgi:hypothetical protein